MESSTQEDSLIFGNGRRHSTHLWPWLDPQMRSEGSADDTLVDNVASLENDDSFLFSKNNNSQSPLVSRLYDTDESLRAHEDLPRGYDTLGDTQIIRRNAYDTRGENGTLFGENLVEISLFQDTQVIPRKRASVTDQGEIANTQVIGQLVNSDTHRLPRASLSSFNGSDNGRCTLITMKNETMNQASKLEVSPGLDLGLVDDTPKISAATEAFLGDIQANTVRSIVSTNWHNDVPDTQVIPPKRSLRRSGIAQTLFRSGLGQTQLLDTSPFLVYEPILSSPNRTELVIHSSPAKVPKSSVGGTNDSAAISSTEVPEKSAIDDLENGYNSPINDNNNDPSNDHNVSETENVRPLLNLTESPQMGSVTFDVFSDQAAKMEPTTQVLNTQEEYMDTDHEAPVDLACRPVFSSSQRPQLGIESDDDMGSLLNDDSIICLKRRKIALSSLSQSSGSLKSSETRETGEPRETLKEGGELEGFSKEPKKKMGTESDSSSELEDKSQEATDLKFGALPKLPGPKTPQKADQKVKEIPISTKEQPKTLREEAPANSSRDVVKNVNAVWALYQFLKFPGKVVQYGEMFSLVELFNGLEIEARNSDLHLLDICVGDIVRLKGSHIDYIVAGLTLRSSELQIRCIRGYDSVVLAKKTKFIALKNEFTVSMDDIYMELDQWAVHQLRFRILQDGVNFLQDNYTWVRQVLDAENLQAATLYDVQALAELKLEKTQVSPRKQAKDAAAARKSDLFAGMLFFVTSIQGARKTHLKDVIVANGGLVIDDEIKNMTIRESSFFGKLILSLKYLVPFKFGALLSTGFSRSAKYLQALALGWPILADCFIDKAIENHDFLANWPICLLPAGHSTYTKTVTNLDVYEFRAKFDLGCFLSEQLQNNSPLLKGYTMIIFDRRQDNKMVDMCDFIFHAFGAHGVKKLRNPTDVDFFLRKNRSLKCLVYDNSQSEYTTSHGAKPMKRRARVVTKLKVGVVDWEWIVQCVISKYIWDPEHYVEV